MSDSCGKMLQMGIAGRAHGIKGEISVDWQAQTVPSANTTLYFQVPGLGLSSHTVVSARRHKGRLLLQLAGVDDRTTAEKFNGAGIFIPRSSLPALEDNEAYLADLPGCEVVLEDGQVIGVLDHLEFPANQEVWSIKASNGREILFPAQPCFIVSFDLQKRRICINPPQGLLDIYNA